jgi:pimeloyl-[acyl-carrier protein] methyl ester esterase
MQNTTHLHSSSDLDLVFLHGWGMNSAIFADFILQLQAHLKSEEYSGVTVRALDLLGYGDFAVTDSEIVEDLQCEVLGSEVDCEVSHHIKHSQSNLIQNAFFIESKLKSNTILIGWSLGGLIAQQVALMQSDKLKGLICLCSSPKFASSIPWKGIELEVLRSFQQQLLRDPIKTLKRFLAIQNLGQTRAKANIQIMLNSLASKASPSAETLKNGLGLLETVDIRDKIANIAVPTLRIYGRLDSLVPHVSIAQIANLQTQANHVVYEKASHAPFISHAEDLIFDILDFIKNLKKG